MDSPHRSTSSTPSASLSPASRSDPTTRVSIDVLRATMLQPSGSSVVHGVPAGAPVVRTARTLEVARNAGAPISVIGVGTTPEQPQLCAYDSAKWVLCRLEHDPLFQSGAFPIPRAQSRQLAKLNKAGVDMDLLFVAHELPADTPPSLLPSQSGSRPVPVSPSLLPELIRHPGPAVSTKRATERAGRFASSVISCGRAIGIAAGAAVSAAGAGVGGLLCDPIIFGAQQIAGSGNVAVIYELVRWDW